MDSETLSFRIMNTFYLQTLIKIFH